MNDLLKERNEFAKQCYLACLSNGKNAITTECAMRCADDMMKTLHGNAWRKIEDGTQVDIIPNAETTTQPVADTSKDGISIYSNKEGKKWVRVKILDEDFLIAANNLDNGREFKWNEAMDYLKKAGATTFTKKQTHLVCAFIDTINAKLREIGGEELKGYYWSSTECNDGGAWNVLFSSGVIYNDSKYLTFVVRPVAAF